MGGIGRVAAAGVMLAGTFFAVSKPAASLAAVIPDGLLVRVYDNAGILAGDRARAISRAREILSRAGLDVDFHDCPAHGAKAPACAVPTGSGELIVRLTRSASPFEPGKHDPPHAAPALGNSLIDARTGTGTLATVFIDRIEVMAETTHADRWTMIGRVMAHEIGHLVLGTNTHSASGLMREIWTFAELTRNRAQDWMFSGAQRDRLREARLLGRRITTATARGTVAGFGQQPGTP